MKTYSPSLQSPLNVRSSHVRCRNKRVSSSRGVRARLLIVRTASSFNCEFFNSNWKMRSFSAERQSSWPVFASKPDK